MATTKESIAKGVRSRQDDEEFTQQKSDQLGKNDEYFFIKKVVSFKRDGRWLYHRKGIRFANAKLMLSEGIREAGVS